MIETYTSEYSLGAAFIQDGRPVAFAFKTLTDNKTRYVTIEHKCLSVCFGLEKFHTYVYGRHITVHSDQKTPEKIQMKSIYAATPQLQRMLLYAYRKIITQFNISQEKKWYWQTTTVTFHPEKKACQLNYIKT